MTITIVPATADRFDDVEHTFSGAGTDSAANTSGGL
mgnify:CR=1 FL=1|jgi:hypothetical protein